MGKILMLKSFAGLAFPVIAALLATSGCSSLRTDTPPGPDGENKTVQLTPSFDRFPDMPLPNGYELDMQRTLVFGSNDTWFGRMVVLMKFGSNEMFDFYKQELPRFGWQEVTSIRAPISVLTYTRKDRVATIQVQGRTLGGSEVLITVSPKGMPVGRGGGATTAAPAPSGSPAPRTPVQTSR
jgi:hypothetical protein